MTLYHETQELRPHSCFLLFTRDLRIIHNHFIVDNEILACKSVHPFPQWSIPVPHLLSPLPPALPPKKTISATTNVYASSLKKFLTALILSRNDLWAKCTSQALPEDSNHLSLKIIVQQWGAGEGEVTDLDQSGCGDGEGSEGNRGRHTIVDANGEGGEDHEGSYTFTLYITRTRRFFSASHLIAHLSTFTLPRLKSSTSTPTTSHVHPIISHPPTSRDSSLNLHIRTVW